MTFLMNCLKHLFLVVFDFFFDNCFSFLYQPHWGSFVFFLGFSKSFFLLREKISEHQKKTLERGEGGSAAAGGRGGMAGHWALGNGHLVNMV